MRRVLLISLSLILAVVGWNMVCAEDFYVIPVMKGKYAPVPKTGQTTTYVPRDDGDLEMGVPWPTPRFTDNGNGTVTDNLTGLMWQKNANCIATYYPGFDNDYTPADGKVTWAHALEFVAGINTGTYPLCGAGYSDWRLPNVKELHSHVNYGTSYPALPAGHPFVGVQSSYYWSSTTYDGYPPIAWSVGFNYGTVDGSDKDGSSNYVWCVRGGK